MSSLSKLRIALSSSETASSSVSGSQTGAGAADWEADQVGRRARAVVDLMLGEAESCCCCAMGGESRASSVVAKGCNSSAELRSAFTNFRALVGARVEGGVVGIKEETSSTGGGGRRRGGRGGGRSGSGSEVTSGASDGAAFKALTSSTLLKNEEDENETSSVLGRTSRVNDAGPSRPV